jgi:hypothetical protein
LKTLPTYVCWYIWIDRNKSIFDDLRPSVQIIVFLSRSACGFHFESSQRKYLSESCAFFPADKTLAWFDGATQQNGLLSGAGGVIKIDDLREYRWILNCGKGTNTRAELMGAWATIVLAVRLSVSDLHVLGDSKIVIDWLNKKGDLRVENLDAWKERIVEICLFSDLSLLRIL